MKINYKRLLLGTLAFCLWHQSIKAQTPTSLESRDFRDSATTPGDYFHSFQFHFKKNSVMGLPASGKNYVSLLGLRAWGDNSGGKAHEMAFADDNQVYVRSGMTPTWESWRRLITEDTSGSVGIGTLSPGVKLGIFTQQASDGLKINHNNTGFVRLSANSLTQNSWNPITQNGDGGIVFGSANTTTNFGFVIAPWSNSLSGLRVDKNGNVGIGTADTKGRKLAVNGDAIFTKIIVKQYSAWADYVFEASYDLRPLSEVERFIHQNKHLPDVPSAKEVARDGLDLGENQVVLLKKIEELTLYIIEQEKANEQLTKKLEEQGQSQQQLINQLTLLQRQVQQLCKPVE